MLSLVTVCIASCGLSIALRWAAERYRGNLACLIGCLYVGTLAALPGRTLRAMAARGLGPGERTLDLVLRADDPLT